jgi:Transposase DDE domain group 1
LGSADRALHLAPCDRRIRRHWPKVRILVHGDSHYLSPETLDFLNVANYVLGLAINEKLKEIATP